MVNCTDLFTDQKFNPFIPTFFWLCQKWVYQSIHGHTGLTHLLIFWHLGTLALSPERQSAECQKIKKGGLDRYGREHFEV